MVRVFIAIILISVTLEVAVKGQTCSQNDFRSYTHCIQKREANHWCSARGCTECDGKSCQKTCQGFACGNCPKGNCCNGQNCNACYDSNCCSVAACNYCITTCRHACSNQNLCLTTCIPQCQNGTHEVFVVPLASDIPGRQVVTVYIKGIPHKGRVTSGEVPVTNKTVIVSVDGIDQPATVLKLSLVVQQNPDINEISAPCANNPSTGKCCEDVNCKSCYQSCSLGCTTRSCRSNCSNKCTTKPKWKHENRTIVLSHPKTGRFNVSTVINITNVINNTNMVESPVFLNNTNVSNFTIPILSLNQTEELIYHNYTQLQKGCCHVVHPEQCYTSQVYPYRHCYRRTHKECSSLCTSEYVHITPNVTPQPQVQNQCHYINSYPYVYCGQNSVQNCDSCYVCNGQYNPNSCAQQTGCSNACKQNVSPPGVANYQQLQSVGSLQASPPYYPAQQFRASQPFQAGQAFQAVQPYQVVQPAQPYQVVQPYQAVQAFQAPRQFQTTQSQQLIQAHQPRGHYRVVHPGTSEYQHLIRLLRNQGRQMGGIAAPYG